MTQFQNSHLTDAMPADWSNPSIVQASVARRSFEATSKRHGFGFLSIPDLSQAGAWRAVSAESGVEADTALALFWQQGVVSICEQVGPVRYAHLGDPNHPDFFEGRHYFDFVAVGRDGRRIAYMVRPRSLQDAKFESVFEALATTPATGTYCDEMRAVARDDFYPSAPANAAFAINCLAHGDAAADESIKPHLPIGHTITSVRSLVEAADVGGGRGLRSVARFILCGFVQQFEDDELQMSSTLVGVQ